MIFYTLDGTEPTQASASGANPATISVAEGTVVKFFASANGRPSSPVQTETYHIDRLGPIALDNVFATAFGADIKLTWTNPTAANFKDVVIVRSVDVATTLIADASPVAVGDPVGASKVVFIGTGASFIDVNPGAGSSAYVAYARYSNDVYAEGRAASGYVEPAAQTGAFQIDVTAQTVTVTTQPSAYALTVSNVLFGEGVQFDVATATTLRGTTFMPRLVVPEFAGSISGTTSGSNTLVALAPALANGVASATTRVSVATGATVTVPFTIEHGRVWYGQNRGDTAAFDLESDLPFASALPEPASGGESSGTYSTIIPSPDGRWVYASQRYASGIIKVDVTTGRAVATTELPITNGKGSARIALDPSGRRLYAVYNDGRHAGSCCRARGNNTTLSTFFIEIATGSMAEVSRQTVPGQDQTLPVARDLALTRDARSAAFPVSHRDTTTPGIALYNLSTMQLRDADPATTGVQLVAVPANPRRCVFTWAGDKLACSARPSPNSEATEQLLVINVADLQITSFNTSKIRALAALPDGSVAIAADNLQLLNATNTAVTDFGNPPFSVNESRGFALTRTGLVIEAVNGIFQIDPTGTLSQLSRNGDRQHAYNVTPF
jgi:hypothetical protein